MKTNMPKCMANAFFYRLKFETIHLMTNYLVGGQPLTWWLVIDIVGWLLTLLASQKVIANIKIGAHSLHESCGKLSQISSKRRMSLFGLLELEIWAEHRTVSGLQDRFRRLFCY
jgi:hypothetical protein